MNSKMVIKNQKYEDYWKLTLGTSNIYGYQFIRTLKIIIEHIDKYNLANKSKNDLIRGNKLNQKVTHAKELEADIKKVYTNEDPSGATTRKQINQYIKLGFIKPYLNGYCSAAKEYIKDGQDNETLKRLFSDTVYQYASFSSSRTHKSSFNEIKFLVQTILNRESKQLTAKELMGLMTDTKVLAKSYANEKTIQADKNWAEKDGFKERKYNQIRYVCNVLSKMSMFVVTGKKYVDKVILLASNAAEYFPEPGKTKRDPYRFILMKKAVYDESYSVYHKKICWLTKKESRGLVVSHLYPSADALAKYDNDAAYDPQNALLLLPGNPDDYVDKCDMTFDSNGNPIFAADDNSSFVRESQTYNYKIDKKILTPRRLYYLKKHNELFEKKHNKHTK